MYSSKDEMNFSALFLSYRKVFWVISIKYDAKMQDEKINYSFSFFKGRKQWGLEWIYLSI